MRAVAQVSEAAAIGVAAPGGGPERLVLFLVLREEGINGCATNTACEKGGKPTSRGSLEENLMVECQTAIRNSLNPLFRVDRVVLRDSLPRTASNKVMRRLLRDELRPSLRARL